MAYFNTKNQSKIYYERSGKEGALSLIFIHGFTCDHTYWKYQTRSFEQDFDVVALDLGGHGQSTSDISRCNITSYAEDVAELISALSLNKPILIGHSMGCRVSICAAGMLDNQVRGLALLDSGLLADEQDLEAILGIIDGMIANTGYPAFARALFESMFLDSADPELKARVIEQAMAFDAEIGHQLGKDLIAWEALEQRTTLKKITAPILGVVTTVVTQGLSRRPIELDERDPWSQMMLENAPQTEIVNIPETGHFIMQERPEELNALLKEFFDRHSG